MSSRLHALLWCKSNTASNLNLYVTLGLILLIFIWHVSSLVGAFFINLSAITLIQSVDLPYYIAVSSLGSSAQRQEVRVATQYLIQAERNIPDSSRVHRMLGIIGLLTADIQGAIREYGRASVIITYDPLIFAEYSLVLDIAGMNEKALSYWRSYRLAEWLVTLASNYEALGRSFQAGRYYSIALDIEPDNPRVLESAANFYYTHQLTDKAIKAYPRLATLEASRKGSKELAYAFLMLGKTICEQKENCDLAMEYFTRAVKLDPSYVQAYMAAGLALRRVGRYAESSKWFARAGILSPTSQDPDRFMGLNAYDQGLFAQAVEHFEAATRKESPTPEEYYYLGLSYYHMGKFGDAVINLEIAVDLWQRLDRKSGGPEYLRALASAYQAIGDIEKAVAMYERVLTIKPDDTKVREQLLLLRYRK